jgi:hypothetical protein
VKLDWNKAALQFVYGIMRGNWRAALIVLFCVTVALCSARSEFRGQLVGHWRLDPNKSKIYPGSQWLTRQMEIRLQSELVSIGQQQTFGDGEEAINRSETVNIPLHGGSTADGAKTAVHWKRHSVTIRYRTADHKYETLIRYVLSSPNTLVRSTTVTLVENEKKLVVLDECELFRRFQ